MRLLERLQPKRTTTLTALELPEDLHLAVHGESHYQPALRETARLATEEDGERAFRAILVAETDNEYDPNAIAVYSTAGKVGYVPRDDAPAYRPVFEEIARQGCGAGACTGLLIGGTPTKPYFGVVLRLSDPDTCLSDLVRED